MKKDELRWLFSSGPDEKTGQRRYGTFLTSLVVHLLVVFWVALGSSILPQRVPSDPADQEMTKRLGFLAFPREHKEVLRAPPPVRPKILEKVRNLRPRPPEFNPKALRVPGSESATRKTEKPTTTEEFRLPSPEPKPTVLPPTAPLVPDFEPLQRVKSNWYSEEQGRREATSIESANSFVTTAKEKALKSNLKDLYAGLRLPGEKGPGSESRKINSGRSGSVSRGEGRTRDNFGKRKLDFLVERPTILSDTQGVDFGSWLTAAYFRVRNNWYSVIPQVYRSGLRGVVVIMFDVHRNGSLEELEVVRSSNFSPYDRAAISSLKLSEPLPNFPGDFTQDRLTLQFTYLYNISP